MIRWSNRGCLLKDFYDIFNIPYPTYEEISKAISHLSELFSNYSWYLTSISSDNIRSKIEEDFKLLLADIFGELAISIKLAGEGYISYSLREIRAVLDILFAGLFTISSWTPGSLRDQEGINPMANAFFSGYWGKMEVLNLDSLIPSILKFGEEGKGVVTSLEELSNRFYQDIISEFSLNKEEIGEKEEQKLKELLKESLSGFFTKFLKTKSVWADIAKEAFGNTDNFFSLFINNDQTTLRSCEEHEKKMLENLSKKLGAYVESTEDIKQKLSLLTFTLTESNEDEHNLCNYCENKASIYGIYARPDTGAMVKLIKLQLKKEELKGINSCLKESFEIIGKNNKKTYFGDIIYSELYSKLNDYVHSNIVEEPSIGEWFYNFFAPTIVVLQCVLSRPIWTGNRIK